MQSMQRFRGQTLLRLQQPWKWLYQRSGRVLQSRDCHAMAPGAMDQRISLALSSGNVSKALQYLEESPGDVVSEQFSPETARKSMMQLLFAGDLDATRRFVAALIGASLDNPKRYSAALAMYLTQAVDNGEIELAADIAVCLGGSASASVVTKFADKHGSRAGSMALEHIKDNPLRNDALTMVLLSHLLSSNGSVFPHLATLPDFNHLYNAVGSAIQQGRDTIDMATLSTAANGAAPASEIAHDLSFGEAWMWKAAEVFGIEAIPTSHMCRLAEGPLHRMFAVGEVTLGLKHVREGWRHGMVWEPFLRRLIRVVLYARHNDMMSHEEALAWFHELLRRLSDTRLLRPEDASRVMDYLIKTNEYELATLVIHQETEFMHSIMKRKEEGGEGGGARAATSWRIGQERSIARLIGASVRRGRFDVVFGILPLLSNFWRLSPQEGEELLRVAVEVLRNSPATQSGKGNPTSLPHKTQSELSSHEAELWKEFGLWDRMESRKGAAVVEGEEVKEEEKEGKEEGAHEQVQRRDWSSMWPHIEGLELLWYPPQQVVNAVYTAGRPKFKGLPASSDAVPPRMTAEDTEAASASSSKVSNVRWPSLQTVSKVVLSLFVKSGEPKGVELWSQSLKNDPRFMQDYSIDVETAVAKVQGRAVPEGRKSAANRSTVERSFAKLKLMGGDTVDYNSVIHMAFASGQPELALDTFSLLVEADWRLHKEMEAALLDAKALPRSQRRHKLRELRKRKLNIDSMSSSGKYFQKDMARVDAVTLRSMFQVCIYSLCCTYSPHCSHFTAVLLFLRSLARPLLPSFQGLLGCERDRFKAEGRTGNLDLPLTDSLGNSYKTEVWKLLASSFLERDDVAEVEPQQALLRHRWSLGGVFGALGGRRTSAAVGPAHAAVEQDDDGSHSDSDLSELEVDEALTSEDDEGSAPKGPEGGAQLQMELPWTNPGLDLGDDGTPMEGELYESYLGIVNSTGEVGIHLLPPVIKAAASLGVPWGHITDAAERTIMWGLKSTPRPVVKRFFDECLKAGLFARNFKVCGSLNTMFQGSYFVDVRRTRPPVAQLFIERLLELLVDAYVVIANYSIVLL